MTKPVIYADYLKTDELGRLILICYGTIKDLEKYGIAFEEGLALTFYMDDADNLGNLDNLLVDGIVEYDDEAQHWVAIIDEGTFRHESEESVRLSG